MQHIYFFSEPQSWIIKKIKELHQLTEQKPTPKKTA
jgi:hypothetical protein